VLPRNLDSRSEVPRSKAEGLVLDFSPILFALGRFRTAPSGLRFRSSAADLNPLPLLSSGCPSPRSFTSTFRPHPHALASAPLLGLCPLQRSTESGVRSPADPTAGTVRPQGFSPSRRLAPPETMQGLFHPRCAHGVLPAKVRLERIFRSARGDLTRCPLHGFLLPRDEHVLACSPVLRVATLTRRYPFGARRRAAAGTARSRSQENRCIPR